MSAGGYGVGTFNRPSGSAYPRKKLTNVRDAAKGVSKPGATYIIDDIDFTPTVAEYEQSRAKLRELLYNKVKADRARELYPLGVDGIFRIARMRWRAFYPLTLGEGRGSR
jgi:hypothetical protein